MNTEFMFFAGQTKIVPADFLDERPKRARIDGGQCCHTLQMAPFHPLIKGLLGLGGQQHATGRGDVSRESGAQVQAVGNHAATAGGRRVAIVATASNDHHLICVQNHRRKRLLCLNCQPVQCRLQRTRQTSRRQVAAGKAQHLAGQPKVASVSFQIPEVRQGEQVTARGGARQTRALGGQRGIEVLMLGIKALQNGHAFGHPFYQVGLGNGHGLAPFCTQLIVRLSHNWCNHRTLVQRHTLQPQDKSLTLASSQQECI